MTNPDDITIPDAVRQLLAIVKRLRDTYGDRKKFTLDGRLVGDIGEILAEEAYDLELYENIKAKYDATDGGGRLVQIKTTMGDKELTFPYDHVPELYLGLKVNPDGTFVEIFNGPGSIAAKAIERLNFVPKSNLYNVRLSTLVKLQSSVPEEDKIRPRADA